MGSQWGRKAGEDYNSGAMRRRSFKEERDPRANTQPSRGELCLPGNSAMEQASDEGGQT